ncbi:response regulator [Christiangramia sp.]|uniref:response regulator n=1 Tax=Christiangramia sp. TaxID=1931228 RepID=UPI002635B7C1|nr:response regulator [Christiangramia sp.]
MNTLILLIDDDKITNIVNRKIIRKKKADVIIKDFQTANHALEFLMHKKPEDFNVIIFLDINMPEISGWEFISLLEKNIKYKYVLYLLTSSIDENDKLRSEKLASVRSFISKPLTIQKLDKLDLI